MSSIEVMRQDLIEYVNSHPIEQIESLLEIWLDYEYKPNRWETQSQFEERRNIVIPLLIERKLTHYELEEA